jgi:hypothetical protein
MFMPSHLLETYIRNPSLFFISFFHPSTYRKRSTTYMCGEVSFAKFLFLSNWFVKLLQANFSCFSKSRWMPNWIAKLLELLHPKILPPQEVVFVLVLVDPTQFTNFPPPLSLFHTGSPCPYPILSPLPQRRRLDPPVPAMASRSATTTPQHHRRTPSTNVTTSSNQHRLLLPPVSLPHPQRMVMHEVQVELALGEDHDGLLMRPWAASYGACQRRRWHWESVQLGEMYAEKEREQVVEIFNLPPLPRSTPSATSHHRASSPWPHASARSRPPADDYERWRLNSPDPPSGMDDRAPPLLEAVAP